MRNEQHASLTMNKKKKNKLKIIYDIGLWFNNIAQVHRDLFKTDIHKYVDNIYYCYIIPTVRTIYQCIIVIIQFIILIVVDTLRNYETNTATR